MGNTNIVARYGAGKAFPEKGNKQIAGDARETAATRKRRPARATEGKAVKSNMGDNPAVQEQW